MHKRRIRIRLFRHTFGCFRAVECFESHPRYIQTLFHIDPRARGVTCRQKKTEQKPPCESARPLPGEDPKAERGPGWAQNLDLNRRAYVGLGLSLSGRPSPTARAAELAHLVPVELHNHVGVRHAHGTGGPRQPSSTDDPNPKQRYYIVFHVHLIRSAGRKPWPLEAHGRERTWGRDRAPLSYPSPSEEVESSVVSKKIEQKNINRVRGVTRGGAKTRL